MVRQTVGRSGLAPRHSELPARNQLSPLHGLPDRSGGFVLAVAVPFTLSGYRTLTALSGLYDATNPDLSSFAADGGRLIIYQGWADQAIPPFGTVGYYKSVVKMPADTRRARPSLASTWFPRIPLLAGGDRGSPARTS